MDGNSQSMEVMSNFDLKRYLYMTTSGINDSKLYLSEMKSIFGNKFNKPNFILDKYIEPSRSVYIRGYIDVLFESESISEIVKNINIENQTTYHGATLNRPLTPNRIRRRLNYSYVMIFYKYFINII